MTDDAARRELFAVLAHELRSPIGAILGFEELVSEGILGEISPRTADAMARIRSSARQLLDLVAGLNDLALSDAETGDTSLETTDSLELLRSAVASLSHEAAGRETTLSDQLPAQLPDINTDTERVHRALQLALMAAVKATAGNTIRIAAHADESALTFEILDTRLDVDRDEPERSLLASDRARLSGPGLRVAMARKALAPLRGDVRLVATATGTTLSVRLPFQR